MTRIPDLAAILLIALLGLSFALGLMALIIPAIGWQPLSGEWLAPSAVWHNLFSQPEWTGAMINSLSSGITATILSFCCAFALVAKWGLSKHATKLSSAMAPILSIPHVATTIGLSFLIVPSGWIARFFSPWLTDWTRPPDLITAQDPYGLSLIAALVIKETPYLVFVMMAAISTPAFKQHLITAQRLGYHPLSAWWLIGVPFLYRQVRLPILIVLSFNLTVVDVAQLIGPDLPSTLAVVILGWFQDPALDKIPLASAGATVLLLMVIIVMIFWEFAVQFILNRISKQTVHGQRKLAVTEWLINTFAKLGLGAIGLAFVSLFILPIWAFTERWRFPNAWPTSWTLANINRSANDVFELATQTVWLGLSSTLLALMTCLLLLEWLRQHRHREKYVVSLLYLPLILPQVAFVFGIQIATISTGIHAPAVMTVFLHWLYVTPYVLLTLQAPYLSYNQAFLNEANRLSYAPFHNYVIVKLAMLKPILFTAFAIGFAVSVAQYLPTLIGGDGRISTLTTEAVAQGATGDRKRVATISLFQALLPLSIFLIAALVPNYWTRIRLYWSHRNA